MCMVAVCSGSSTATFMVAEGSFAFYPKRGSVLLMVLTLFFQNEKICLIGKWAMALALFSDDREELCDLSRG